MTENGRQIPGVAQPAMQMGDHAAKMIGEDMEGRPRTKFHYFDKGDMATIGRNKAVADVKWPFKAHWGGFAAWATWLAGAHLFSGRVPQPHRRDAAMGLDLHHAKPRGPAGHRQPVSARLGAEHAEARDPLRKDPLDLASPSLSPKLADSVSGQQQDRETRPKRRRSSTLSVQQLERRKNEDASK